MEMLGKSRLHRGGTVVIVIAALVVVSGNTVATWMMMIVRKFAAFMGMPMAWRRDTDQQHGDRKPKSRQHS